jgi:serine/threonine protein kinase
VLNANAGGDAEALARFRREGSSACRVRHPNAVGVLDFGVTEGGIAYLVMELLEGTSLEDLLKHERRPALRRVGEIMAPVAAALAEAHKHGVVHRDVKPSNVFLHRTATGEEVPKVLDFGIAKLAGEAVLSQRLTMDGFLLGTPAYMAPERFRSQGYGPPSDVYSVGVTLYEMLTGQLPFVVESQDPLQLVALQAEATPVPVRELAPLVPAAVESLVQSALARSPERRPTAEELGRELVAATAAASRAS